MDNRTWDPTIPRDMTKAPPPVAGDHTAMCGACSGRFPVTAMNVTAYGYQCSACAVKAMASEGAQIDPGKKIGRGRWWIMPIVIAIGGTVTILYPAAVLVVVVVVAMLCFRLFMRRGL